MSEPVLISKEYTLVIDTDSLSTAFVKKLCAYCTGFVDETESDLEFADLYYLDENIEDDESSKGKLAEEKNLFFEFVSQRLDEDQIFSPCCIWLNKRYGYNNDCESAVLTEDNFSEYSFPAPFSVGIFFDEMPTAEHILKIKERSLKFFNDVWPKLSTTKITIEGYRLITHTKYGEESSL